MYIYNTITQQKLSEWVISFDWISFRFDRRYCHLTKKTFIVVSHFFILPFHLLTLITLELYISNSLGHTTVNGILVTSKSRCHMTRKKKEKYITRKRKSRLTSSECHNTIYFWGQANWSIFFLQQLSSPLRNR